MSFQSVQLLYPSLSCHVLFSFSLFSILCSYVCFPLCSVMSFQSVQLRLFPTLFSYVFSVCAVTSVSHSVQLCLFSLCSYVCFPISDTTTFQYVQLRLISSMSSYIIFPICSVTSVFQYVPLCLFSNLSSYIHFPNLSSYICFSVCPVMSVF